MESKTHTEMDSSPPQQDQSKSQMEGTSEVNFLKDLYMFMKKRDSPIERIPHLGFKQIDLYLMYQTVMGLGGYEQVTAQQLWKQVYNTLGGNPRSTSAATCTRRHYEKLLLPYECHSKGITMKVLPQLPPKSLPFLPYNREEDSEGLRPLKRKIFLPPQQHLQPDPRDFAIPLSLYAPMTHPFVASYIPAASQTPFTLPPHSINLAESFKEPLQHLRFLSERYKSWSGLSRPDPLNLVKSPDENEDGGPTSSFSAPPPSKNPKFLNTPYPLYSKQHPRLGSNNPQEVALDEPVSVVGTSEDSGEYIIDLTSKRRSPFGDPSLKNPPDIPRKPDSPKTDYHNPERLRSPDVKTIDSLPSPLQHSTRKMEIEVPLSVFQKWLQLCGPLATVQGLKQLQPLIQEEPSRQRDSSENDLLHGNLSFQIDSQHHDASSTAEDLRIRKVPSATSPDQTSVTHPGGAQNPATSYKPPALTGFQKASRELSHFDRRYGNMDKSSWTAYNTPSPVPVKLDYAQPQMGLVNQEQERAPSSVYMGNSSADPMLQLTKDEVMKLKRMIYSSM
ncbi:AT-rich interaction domain 6 [Synchiropus picturatus]